MEKISSMEIAFFLLSLRQSRPRGHGPVPPPPPPLSSYFLLYLYHLNKYQMIGIKKLILLMDFLLIMMMVH
jgi:hypothetical protein